MAYIGQTSLQDANSPVMEDMVLFYDHAMFILMMIVSSIFYILAYMKKNLLVNRFLLNGQSAEVMWTMTPMGFLLALAFPSLKILYITDEINSPLLSVKAVGHQWYWSYEYDDFSSANFDSFLDKDDENVSAFRLLDVDNRVILPVKSQVRMIITSMDVIHSFTIPALGMKVDAIPGRLNQICFAMHRTGLFFGQCSEICGVNHSFMPIVLESTFLENFFDWIIFNY